MSGSALERMSLEMSRHLGGHVSQRAIFDAGRCTWEVRVPDVSDIRGRSSRSTIAGPGLYQGTAGIALYLGELWAQTRDAGLGRCASGAIEFALGAAAAPEVTSFGLYSGSSGVALAAIRLADVLERDDLTERGLDLLTRAYARRHARRQSGDIIEGAAGAILACLEIHRRVGDHAALAIALELGEEIERAARKRPVGWSWPNSAIPSRQDLCGYAHGASGYAHAFLELFAHDGNGRWAHAAKRALDYESAHALLQRGDWPDFRANELSRLLMSEGSASLLRERLLAAPEALLNPRAQAMRAWCHGAPGIVPVRLRAQQLGLLTRDGEGELAGAVRATEHSIAPESIDNFSVCHGAMGNADVLLDVAQVRGVPRAAAVDALVEQVAEMYRRQEWPPRTGVPSGADDPSLLLGQAGIGYTLLRVCSLQTPSILFVSSWRPIAPVREATDASALQHGEIWWHLDPLERVLLECRVPETDREQLVLCVTKAQSVQEGVRAVLDYVYATPGLELLQDAVAPVAAALEHEATQDNYVPQYVAQKLYSLQASPASLTDRLALSESVRLVSSSFAWSRWEKSEPEPPPGEETTLVASGAAGTEVVVLSPLEAIVFRALREPLVLRQVVDSVGGTHAAREVLGEVSAAVLEIVDYGMRAGYIVRAVESLDEGGAPGRATVRENRAF